MMKRTSAAVTLAACCSIIGRGDAQDRLPTFDVATVKPSIAASPPISIQRLPGRLITSNTSLPMLIRWAYQLDEDRLLGVPKGLESTRFDVLATFPEQTLVAGQLQLMMRALLAERFRLVVHHETRELVAYALLAEAGGPKVRVSEPTEPPGPNPFRMTDAGTLTGTRVTADMLATVLSNQLGRPVTNMTDLSGAFDFSLRWAPDSAAVTPEFQDRSSLFTAIRDQLGFRLEARKALTDVVVIDHVERTPIDN